MVGSAIVRELKNKGYKNLIYKAHDELDLLVQSEAVDFFQQEKPEIVFVAAARVGGINANNTYRAEFLYENLEIQNNIIHLSHKYSVKKLIFLGSACIYPKSSKQPIKEEYLLSNYLEYTNEPYAIAKIAGIKLCESYFHQYGSNFISVMPNNLYGPNDNFNLETSHVLPALMRKFHEAKEQNHNSVEIWGTGSPLREFLHVDDLASACVFLMENLNANKLYNLSSNKPKHNQSNENDNYNISHINIGSGQEISIKDLAILIKEIIGYKGDLLFNPKYPDGVPRKFLDISRLNLMGWESKIKLKEGIASTYKWYKNNHCS